MMIFRYFNRVLFVTVFLFQQLFIPVYASTTIQVVGNTVTTNIIFTVPGFSGKTSSPTRILCTREDGGDPQKATVDFYGQINCDGQTHIIDNQGVTWPAGLTVRNFDTVPVPLTITLTGGKYSITDQTTLQAVNSCSATLEQDISLGEMVPGASRVMPLTSGIISGSLSLKPSQVQGNEGSLTPGNDILYTIPEATWNTSTQAWVVSGDKDLTISAHARENVSTGIKTGSLTAVISCP
jgi:hypothetical protein